ncbi:MAG TPA: hypothetical protein VEF89_01020 [Solirubrobacteraceae bacterium]|nr:hypothetical protein [Solirubrobacteraceae bacterium]
MFVLATAIVDWDAMWKIFVVVLIAGTGTVVAFGFLLLGLKAANRLGPKETRGEGPRAGGYALAAVCGVLCVGVVVVGIYAMAKKPSSTPAKPKAKAALVIPAGPHKFGGF